MPRGSFTTNTNTNVPVSAPASASVFEPSAEQVAIIDVFLHTDKHMIVEAVAGSGKTRTIVECAKRDKHSKIGLTAFNKHIATELTERMGGQGNVECMTYHSLGYKTVRNNVKHKIQVDQYKVLAYLDTLILPVKSAQEKMAKYRIGSMVSFAKTYGHDATIDEDEMMWIEDRHDLDMNGLRDVVYDYTPRVLRHCMTELSSIDFDDMVWLPYVLKLDVPKYDVLCVDEYQDTSMTQQWIAVRGGKRVCAVGDKNQSIYSFRGCDGTGFDKLRAELQGVVTLPLTLTRRCPKSHVRLAQTIVPQIRALDDAPEGVVRVAASLDAAVSEMRAGDLVVCRVNAELVGTAYKLLKRGVKAVVRGKDIGAGMTKLIELACRRADAPNCTLNLAIQYAGEVTNETVAKFLSIPNGRGEMRASNAQDKYACVCELAEDCKTVSELRSVIERLFSEFEDDGSPKHAVVLGTVHRMKGLEGNRVFVLRPDLIPHPRAKKKEDVQAEMNLLYVASTRAKYGDDAHVIQPNVAAGGDCKCGDGHDAESHKVGELVFVGSMPVVFAEAKMDVKMEALQRVENKSEGNGSVKARNDGYGARGKENGVSSVRSKWSESDLRRKS